LIFFISIVAAGPALPYPGLSKSERSTIPTFADFRLNVVLKR